MSPKRGDKVGVLFNGAKGTCLAPGIVLNVGPRYTSVLYRPDNAQVVRKDIPNGYVDTVGPELAGRWEQHWQELERAVQEEEN